MCHARGPYQETAPMEHLEQQHEKGHGGTRERSGRAARGPGGEEKMLDVMRLRKGAKGGINRADEKTRHEHAGTFHTLLHSNKKAIRVPRCGEGNCTH